MGTELRSDLHLLCQEADAIFLVQLKGLAQDGVERLPGALVAAKRTQAECCNPCHSATKRIPYSHSSTR